MTKVEQIAHDLANSLSKEGILNYLKTSEDKVSNEAKYGRSTLVYSQYVKAAKLALILIQDEQYD